METSGHTTDSRVTVTELNPHVKRAIIRYIFSVFMCFLFDSYSIGKLALMHVRMEDGYVQNRQREWIVVSTKCSETAIYTFWKSLVFPYTILSKIAPWLVLFLNP